MSRPHTLQTFVSTQQIFSHATEVEFHHPDTEGNTQRVKGAETRDGQAFKHKFHLAFGWSAFRTTSPCSGWQRSWCNRSELPWGRNVLCAGASKLVRAITPSLLTSLHVHVFPQRARLHQRYWHSSWSFIGEHHLGREAIASCFFLILS